ncbi:MAG: hypothetical protein U5L11_03310 [Arhodomonas sp.]|nr:hypothetical protein [Arhodomonas sp.]
MSLTAVLVATVIGLPLGAALALYRFPGRSALAGAGRTGRLACRRWSRAW